MKKALRRVSPLPWVLLLVSALLLPASMHAENDVMGEIQFEGKSHVEKTSGVWVDGEYVGYLISILISSRMALLWRGRLVKDGHKCRYHSSPHTPAHPKSSQREVRRLSDVFSSVVFAS